MKGLCTLCFLLILIIESKTGRLLPHGMEQEGSCGESGARRAGGGEGSMRMKGSSGVGGRLELPFIIKAVLPLTYYVEFEYLLNVGPRRSPLRLMMYYMLAT